ncbi:MAG: hypothetical protein ACLPY5_16390 [Candidatus Bathyarchaeia archaeon]
MSAATSTLTDRRVDPVERWLGRLKPISRTTYRSGWNDFMRWLHTQSGWADKSAADLLEFQDQSKGRQRYLLLDLMEEYVQQKGGTYVSMQVRLSHLRCFFIRNRVEMPSPSDWQPQPTREPTQGKLTVDQVKEIITHASLRDAAIFLTMFQGMMDLERFQEFNRSSAEALVEHIRVKGIDEPFRIDFLNGRKRNRDRFYTYLHRDALNAWKIYFERERGWPQTGPIAIRRDKLKGLSKYAIRLAFITLACRLKLREPIGRVHEVSHRTGVAPHEAFRDVVRSLLQTAVKDGFDTACAEFWMGHSIDPLRYNKFADLEPEYVLENARIAAKYLNLISAGHDKELKTVTKQNEELHNQITALRREMTDLRNEFRTDIKKKITNAETS